MAKKKLVMHYETLVEIVEAMRVIKSFHDRTKNPFSGWLHSEYRWDNDLVLGTITLQDDDDSFVFIPDNDFFKEMD